MLNQILFDDYADTDIGWGNYNKKFEDFYNAIKDDKNIIKLFGDTYGDKVRLTYLKHLEDSSKINSDLFSEKHIAPKI